MRFRLSAGTLVKWTLVYRLYSSKVPMQPILKPLEKNNLPAPTKIDQRTIELLERLSLVDFANRRGIEQLEEAIQFADQILPINTENIEPMVSVLEDRTLYLRDDIISEGNCRKEVMANASVVEEEYFVSPPGNIPLAPRKSLLEDDQ